MDVER